MRNTLFLISSFILTTIQALDKKIVCRVDYNSQTPYQSMWTTEPVHQDLANYSPTMRDSFYTYQAKIFPRFGAELFHDFELQVVNNYGQIMALTHANVTNQSPYEGMSLNVGAPSQTNIRFIHYSCGICDQYQDNTLCGLPPPAPKSNVMHYRD